MAAGARLISMFTFFTNSKLPPIHSVSELKNTSKPKTFNSQIKIKIVCKSSKQKHIFPDVSGKFHDSVSAAVSVIFPIGY